MKRLLALFLCLVMLSGTVLAETPETTLTSLDGFFGVWSVCGGNDELTYLILHDDLTYEVYDAWTIDDAYATDGDALMRTGLYTFDPATGAFKFDDYDTVYTAQTFKADESMQTGDGIMDGSPDMDVLVLNAPPQDDFDMGMAYLPTTGVLPLIPGAEVLTVDSAWVMSSTADGEPSADAARWRFSADNTVVLTQNGVETAGTYVYDNGRLTTTMDDGTSTTLLMQKHYIPVTEDTENALYDLETAEDAGWHTALTEAVLVVHDLVACTHYCLIREDN